MSTQVFHQHHGLPDDVKNTTAVVICNRGPQHVCSRLYLCVCLCVCVYACMCECFNHFLQLSVLLLFSVFLNCKELFAYCWKNAPNRISSSCFFFFFFFFFLHSPLVLGAQDGDPPRIALEHGLLLDLVTTPRCEASA